MLTQLQALLRRIDADYADLRHESQLRTLIHYQCQDLRSLSNNETSGFVLRVARKGGLGVVTFSRLEDFEWAVQMATQNAEAMASLTKMPFRIAPAPVVAGTFEPQLREDPRNIPLEEKIALVRSYNERMLAFPGITHTNIVYSEQTRRRSFVNSQGTAVCEPLCVTNLFFRPMAQDGTRRETLRFSVGGVDGFWRLRDRWEELEPVCQTTVQLLKAPALAGGNYRVLFAPPMTGLFVHEAFGHLMEADGFDASPTLRERLKVGTRLGSEHISITADSTLPGQIGFYRFDDEGVPVKRVELLKKGVLTGHLHSRQTAAHMGAEPTGHAIAEDFRYAPVVRMGAIFTEKGHHTPEELLEKLDDGLWVTGGGGGQTTGELFSFEGTCIYRVKNGKPIELLRGTNFTGNLFTTLERVEASGNDFWLEEAGGCGKAGQLNRRSTVGGSSLLISEVAAGG